MLPPSPNSHSNSIQTGSFFDAGPRIVGGAETVRLHYSTCGDATKPLMILLHGFPEFWFAYEGVMPTLAEHFWVVAPDLRGFNLSDKPVEVESYKPALIMADVMALAKHLGRETFVLVAHDWGGAIAWNLAIAHPQAITKLVILNAPHPVPFAHALAWDKEQQAASEYMNWLRAPGSEVPLAENNFDRMMRFLGTELPWFVGATRQAYMKAWSQPSALTGGVNYYRASPLYPPTATDIGAQRLKLDPKKFIVTMPTKVIWGELDVALGLVLLNGLEELVPDLTLERWPDASHWLIHEHPQRCAKSILEFALS
jgi:epoxide hydrolase 4